MSAPVQKFHVWRKPWKAPVDARAAKRDEEKYVGEIEVAIAWSPAGTDYTVGQLTITCEERALIFFVVLREKILKWVEGRDSLQK